VVAPDGSAASKSATPLPGSISVACPGCRRSIPLRSEELSSTIQCARCNTQFVPVPSIQRPESNKPRAVAGSGVQEPAEVLAVLPADGNRGQNTKYCVECGSIIRAKASVCPKCGVSQPRRQEPSQASHLGGPPILGFAGSWTKCPYCGSDAEPYHSEQMAQIGWVVFGVLLLVFFPLCWLGFFIKERYVQCPDCGHRQSSGTTFKFG
jgi:DNA-directed RNA polymerase subunit RPC12/RpoP